MGENKVYRNKKTKKKKVQTFISFAKELGSINSAFVSIQTLTQPLNILRELC